MPAPALPRFVRLVGLMAFASIQLSLSASCENRERQRRCQEGFDAARMDLRNEKLDDAREKLAGMETSCVPRQQHYIDQLRGEIASREAVLRQQAEHAAAEERRRREQPVIPFMEWLRTWTADARKAGVQCHERGDPEFGWCEDVHRVDDGPEFQARFYKAEPRAVRFTLSVDSVVVCNDLGEHRVVRKWRASNDGAERTHCALVSKAHRGLSALVSVRGDHSDVDVFNQAYLDRDATLEALLRSEGR